MWHLWTFKKVYGGSPESNTLQVARNSPELKGSLYPSPSSVYLKLMRKQPKILPPSIYQGHLVPRKGKKKIPLIVSSKWLKSQNDFTPMWNIKQKETNKTKKLMDTDNTMVVTKAEGRWGKDEESKRGQTYTDIKRLDSGYLAQNVIYRYCIIRSVPETYIMLLTNLTPIY